MPVKTKIPSSKIDFVSSDPEIQQGPTSPLAVVRAEDDVVNEDIDEGSDPESDDTIDEEFDTESEEGYDSDDSDSSGGSVNSFAVQPDLIDHLARNPQGPVFGPECINDSLFSSDPDSRKRAERSELAAKAS